MLAFVAPALWDLQADPARPYGYLAADAFYYFTIAANWARFGKPTYDQVHPTNGFHPLWQWMTALTDAVIEWLGQSRFVLPVAAVIGGLLLLSVALVLLGLARVKDGRVSPLFALLPLGAWPLAISPFWWKAKDELPGYRMTPLFGTLWNFCNGMESAVLLTVFSAVVWFYVKRPANTRTRAITLGVLLGALSLARLDHAIFALVIAGLPFMYHLVRRDARRARLDAWTVLGWIGVLVVYLGYNVITVGNAMPVSGAVKSTFPHPNSTSLEVLLAAPTFGLREAMFRLGRHGSIVFPGLFALGYFPFALQLGSSLRRRAPVLRDGHGRFSELMLLTAIGTLGLAAYDVTFVVGYQIGEWYAPVSVLFVSLFVLQIAERVAERWPLPAGRWLGWALFLALNTLGVATFWKLHRVALWGNDYAIFCLGQAERVIRHYGAEPPKLLSRDDGVVAFATGFPTTSGTRLTIDPEGARASDEGRFEPLMIERGIDRVTSLHYLHTRGFRVGERSKRVQAYAQAVLMAKPTRIYEVEYVDRWFGILRAVAPRQK
ncbi:MAG TPA: hypothetical protein VMG12_13695 [Polyangiaceae bacterium]|nr:hypothetical protein [Polyangiaceae bacterium]